MNAMRTLVVLPLMAVVLHAANAWAQKPAWTWYEVDASRNVRVNLYLFWSHSCPHCPKAREFADWLQQRYSWVNVYSYEVTGTAANRELYERMAASLNRAAGATPAFFYCKQMHLGYLSYEQTGRAIEHGLVRWYEALQKHYREHSSSAAGSGLSLAGIFAGPSSPDVPPAPPDLPVELAPEEEKVYVPGWGDISPASLSLPVLTLVLAGCDAFNPCAFFVLLMLLGLIVHSQSRARMLLVGGIFVFFSGLLYFLFMAAWLNLFFVIGHLGFITAAAGVIAVVIGLLNVKEFFWFKRGPSLSIPESARPGLFRRMTRLIDAASLPSIVAGAVALASAANLYELLCTSGFPMVYTRVLSLRELSPTTYYGYLALYNVIYVIPMALIVLGFAVTLGARKLSEYQGRVLKLLSGFMMLALGVVLAFRPEVLNTIVGAVGVLGTALGLTALVVAVDHWRQRRKHSGLGASVERGLTASVKGSS